MFRSITNKIIFLIIVAVLISVFVVERTSTSFIRNSLEKSSRENIELICDSAANSINVYFDRNTGRIPSYLTATYILGSRYKDLPTISKEYPYAFNGWYTEISNGVEINNDTLVELDYDTLYA